VDFSEAEEAKGYVWAQVAKGQTQIEFCPLPVRSFTTLTVDLTAAAAPQETLLAAIAQHPLQDAVVRVMYSVRPDQIDSLDQAALYEALSAAHTYTIHPQIVTQKVRSRLPELTPSSSLDPLDALQTYLSNRADLAELAADMLTAAQALIADEPFEQSDQAATAAPPAADIDDDLRQLRLL
jgi:exonuclease SbcD